MGDPINAATGVNSAGGMANVQGSSREIPEDRVVYAKAETEESSEVSEEFADALLLGAVTFGGTMAIGTVTRGASESKRMQEEAHSQLKEAEGENGG